MDPIIIGSVELDPSEVGGGGDGVEGVEREPNDGFKNSNCKKGNTICNIHLNKLGILVSYIKNAKERH